MRAETENLRPQMNFDDLPPPVMSAAVWGRIRLAWYSDHEGLRDPDEAFGDVR